MKVVVRLLQVFGLLLVIAIIAFAIFVASRQNLTFDAPYPDAIASADPAVIERGRYLVRNVAHCGACHGDPRQRDAVANGEEVPLSGGFKWRIPPGVFRAANLTPDPETGIGRFTDGQIARALRHGVGHDGRALLPFMEMQGLADDDLAAIVSYLRSQPAVEHRVRDHEYSLLGQVLRATVLSSPVGPESHPPRVAPREPGIETGRYLAASVAICWACHTQRSTTTGTLTGARFSGSTEFVDETDPARIWAPPNLTPGPTTGVVARMSEDAFVERMRAGPALPGTPMPWNAYGKMSDDDLRSIYRFLMSLPAVENDVGPSVRVREP